MSGPRPQLFWRSWQERWDRQQTAYIQGREARFDAMFDAVEAQVGGEFVALDLACGPGSLSERLLTRFPRATAIALDYDPVLLHLGQQAVGTLNGRLQWVEADLRSNRWVGQLPKVKFDAVLSTTALHWLHRPRLSRIYTELARLIRPGGIFLNGDGMRYDRKQRSLSRLLQRVNAHRSERAFQSGEVLRWDDWWSELQRESEFRSLFKERRRRYPAAGHHESTLSVEDHCRYLTAAGFEESGVLWRDMESVVLAAVR